MIEKYLHSLKEQIEGELLLDNTTKSIFATDASVYREIPLGVAFPKNTKDIQLVVKCCYEHNIPMITRGAGTSLAGQVVGNGLVMDISRHLTKILEVNVEEKWVRVEPGVVLDELNRFLKPHGLFFGPETSTASRCTMGGMVGNNSCGSHSIVYKTTREHLLEATVILSDGSEAVFRNLDTEDISVRLGFDTLEGEIYRRIHEILSVEANRKTICDEFPDSSIYRRNTGYALDSLANSKLYAADGLHFNLCALLAGSEGTLAVATELKLNLVDLPYANVGLLCAHFQSLEESFAANLIALQHNPSAVELMDNQILAAARKNTEQDRNSFFVKGDPKAILIIEFCRRTEDELMHDMQGLIQHFQNENMGYHFPVITGTDVAKVWSLRKSGLGVLSNIEGDGKPVTVIEDTAVSVEKLPAYMAEMRQILSQHNINCVFHAHVGSGEIHLRPVLNLKEKTDRERFRQIATEVAHLVKKYRGSISGEHGDGRLRSEFIKIVIGLKCYSFLEQIKEAFDPKGIFNPGKIVHPVDMDASLRYAEGQKTRDIPTFFDFSAQQGIVRAVEKCNGSADCRRPNTFSGTMCPTFMATMDESASTRARANVLREFLTNSTKENPFAHHELFKILDLCISCKACKLECPSNIDMAKFKAEFLQHYHDEFGVSVRSRFFAHISIINAIMSLIPPLANFFTQWRFFANPAKRFLGVAQQRNLPKVAPETLRQITRTVRKSIAGKKGTVYLFVDEFTNHTEVDTGVAALALLLKLGYKVKTIRHPQSGRALISKGYLRKAAKIAKKQVSIFEPLISYETPLIGIEPSAILSFRDEYPELLRGAWQQKARNLAKNCLLIEEFIIREFAKGNISQQLFTDKHKTIKLHTHCQQKALVTSKPTVEMLQIPLNYHVHEIRSGCCGMAGAFGYEKEHYELSMKIGELNLFPEIRATEASIIVAANGTSCRQQILDGTGRKALHPIEVLFRALK
jgi:FAD/FMN-containing dehydrogenase/Fe-S oxidoreductase